MVGLKRLVEGVFENIKHERVVERVEVPRFGRNVDTWD